MPILCLLSDSFHHLITVHARDKFIEFTCVICLYVNVIYFVIFAFDL